MATRSQDRKDDDDDDDDQCLRGMKGTDSPIDEILENDKKIADFTARMLNVEEEATLAIYQGRIEQARPQDARVILDVRVDGHE
ncbi:hypothetical protein SARC_05354 [Sphaeroforma arctica JP610]|uniref:Uncharacterized protein n=1 Tax=Sphaeroforma arctica JP610 TaxID=667725 RepID=A0A0L0G0J1_9EUKA|nr:hypothetical protein SARC_05354 [Sphaeroforma arctica JP610]KNC82361.1 hypothetical protein SARC_05354 [Sphaeroforma arctica JP610]|eukprot:XP_014156263.1 hypothetical protein SARC_05354 [Sphaeroforma arctica JP610]